VSMRGMQRRRRRIWHRFKGMTKATDNFEVDCVTASNLKRLVLEEFGDQIMLDEKALDALVSGIVSLLCSDRPGGFTDNPASTLAKVAARQTG
jgi:hypothetical protein